MASAKTILVYAHWQQLAKPVLMGVLSTTLARGKEIFSFEYERSWLGSNQSLQIDPDLQLFSGPQYVREEKRNFGIFLDTSPDRWGRLLMRRREAALARKDNRKEMTLFESDYLLGVYDLHRMGAIRFKEDVEGPFLNDNRAMATPPWTSLRTLEQASLELERDDAVDDQDYIKWLNMLIAPGSSLGGSRPKASVIDTNKSLWIAKFPSRYDEYDIGGWEMVVNELATKAGVRIAEGKALKFGSKYYTFLTKRFDRTAEGDRIHFASAMTLLGYNDGTDFHDGASYLELVEFIMQHGAQVEEDLEELWRRIVFSICVKNTDDHLRNHGFLLTPKGWVLSPAYDINPVPTGTGLSINISQNDNSLDLSLAMDVIEQFNLTEKKARDIVEKVTSSVMHWKALAEKYKIGRNEQELMESAFSDRRLNTPPLKESVLCDAIKKRQRIKFIYKEKERVGEPQCYGISSAGQEVVRVHVLKGGSRPEQLFVVSQIKSLTVLDEHFINPGPNYNPRDKAMKKIFCQL
jgi:serine/threonine-protein kinase HipA